MALTKAQKLCATTFDRPIAVMAGAGSGKTLTLKTRVANAFFEDPQTGQGPVVTSIDEVLAITFTNKAALELKSRIRQELRTRGLVEQAMRVDGAWISTIHGMCSRILKENALALGIDPAFELIPEAIRSQMLNEACEFTLNNDEGCRSDIANLFGEYRRDSLKEMIFTLIEYAEHASDRFGSLEFAPFITPAMPDFDSTAHATELYEARLAEAHKFSAPLKRVAEAVYERFCTKKLERGFMDNNDLLLQAYDALQVPSIAALYTDRFKLVMIDEFQDTDAMQLSIISKLAGKDAERLCVVGDPQQSIYRFRGADLSVCENHVQSLRAAQGDEAIISLADNFRSHSAILDFVDDVFGPEGAPREDGLPNFYQRLLYGRDETKVSAAKRWHTGEGPRMCVHEVQHAYRRADFGRELSCELVARRLRQIHDAGAASTDSGEVTKRGRTWGDMAILLGSMTHANDYARALDRYQIPWVITGGSVFKDKGDALLMVDVAAVLGNPYDSDALYALLSSDIFGFEAQDFLVLPDLVGPQTYTSSNGEVFTREVTFAEAFAQLLTAKKDNPALQNVTAHSKIEHALKVLKRALKRVGRDSTADILETVLAESGWLSRMQHAGSIGSNDKASIGGRVRAANALKAIRMAREVEATGSLGPRAVSESLLAVITGSKETPGVLSATDGDFVRIMTIHKSKGLQFPVVVAAELTPSAPPNRLPMSVSSAQQKSYFCLDLQNSLDAGSELQKSKDDALKELKKVPLSADDAQLSSLIAKANQSESLTSWVDALRRYEAYQDTAELERKLYVAFTRAEEMLIVSLLDQVKAPDIQAALQGLDGDRYDVGKLAKLANKRAGKGKRLSPEDEQAKQEAKTELDRLKAHVQLHSVVPNLSGVPARVAAAAKNMSAKDASCYVLVSAPEVERWAATGELPHCVDASSPEWPEGIEIPFEMADELPTKGSDNVSDVFTIPAELPAVSSVQHGYGYAWTHGLVSASALHTSLAEQDYTPSFYTGSFDDHDISELPAPATEKGTAFHMLGEIAATRWTPGQALQLPEDRIEAVGRYHGLNTEQRADLHTEMKRWLSSPVASEMASHAHLVPEAPFYVALSMPSTSPHRSTEPRSARALHSPGESHDYNEFSQATVPISLNGFIDLLAYDEFGRGTAHVVDYKTGTTLDTNEKRRAHYLIQAQTYAYALLLQGFDEVRLSFVFVDQPDEHALPQICEFPAPGEPAWTRAQLEESLRSQIAALR